VLFNDYKKRCPRCGSIHVNTSKLNPLNYLLVPVNILLKLIPKVGAPLAMKCSDCSHTYTQSYPGKNS
jgi:Zn finger protein HypA/HybF involved in hydrogenase expression